MNKIKTFVDNSVSMVALPIVADASYCCEVFTIGNEWRTDRKTILLLYILNERFA